MTRSLSLSLATVALSVLLSAFAPRQRPPVTTPNELRAAIGAAQPGDTITMADGVWTNLSISFNAQGAEGDSIRLVAETPGGVILDGTSTLRLGGDYLVVDGLRFEGGALSGGAVIEYRDGGRAANHSRVTNTTVIDVNPANKELNYKWISMYGTYNRFDHNYVRGKTNVGTTLVVWLESASRHQPTYHRIDHNHFGPRPPLGQNEGETIRIGTSDTSMQDAYVTVEANLFEECSGEAEIVSNKSGKNVFRGNTFYRSKGSLTLRHGNGALVEGNVFIGGRVSDSGGVRVIGEDHVVINNYFELLGGTGFQSAITIMNGVPNSPLNRYFQVKNVTIAHNTIVRVQQAVTLGAGADSERTLAPDGVQFHNNVLLSAGSSAIRVQDEPARMTWDGTVYWQTSLGIDDPPGVRNVDPLMEQTGGDLFRPAAGSPLLDAAATVDGVEIRFDVDGQPRDSQPDIGADERSSAPSTRARLYPSDVGPSWPGATAGDTRPTRGAGLRLGAPFPNPAVGVVTVPLATDVGEAVTVIVYDTIGRRVAVLTDGPRAAGEHALRWEPTGVAAGRYVIVARSASGTARTSLTLLPR